MIWQIITFYLSFYIGRKLLWITNTKVYCENFKTWIAEFFEYKDIFLAGYYFKTFKMNYFKTFKMNKKLQIFRNFLKTFYKKCFFFVQSTYFPLFTSPINSNMFTTRSSLRCLIAEMESESKSPDKKVLTGCERWIRVFRTNE